MDQAMMMNCAILALVGLTLLVGVLAWLDLRARDSRILSLLEGEQEPLPVQQPRKPWNRAAVVASARRVMEAQRREVPSAKAVGALTGAIDGIGDWGKAPPSARRNWLACSPDGSRIAAAASEPTPRSPVDYRSGLHHIVDAQGEVVSPMAASVEVAAFRSVPEVPPLGEDEERAGWERRSGTWTRGEP